MKFEKTMAIVITALLIVSIGISIVPTNAQTSGQMASFAYLIVEPNPVGVGQTTYIAMMVDVPLPSSSESNALFMRQFICLHIGLFSIL